MDDGDCNAKYLSKLTRCKSNEGALERETEELVLCFRAIASGSKDDERFRFCKKVRIKLGLGINAFRTLFGITEKMLKKP